jgi:hypothetical protein
MQPKTAGCALYNWLPVEQAAGGAGSRLLVAVVFSLTIY